MQEIKYVPIDQLRPHPKNPRKINEKQLDILCESIRKFPTYFEVRPILCNKNMEVYAGNMRLHAARKLGMAEVPVSVMDVSEAEQNEQMIRDNRSNGEWDFDLLGNHWDMPDLLAWGFEERELLGKAFALPETPKEEPKSSEEKNTCPACGQTIA